MRAAGSEAAGFLEAEVTAVADDDVIQQWNADQFAGSRESPGEVHILGDGVGSPDG